MNKPLSSRPHDTIVHTRLSPVAFRFIEVNVLCVEVFHHIMNSVGKDKAEDKAEQSTKK